MTPVDEALLRQMIKESGEMWLAMRDRSKLGSGVVVCANPDHAFYLERADNYTPKPEPFMDGWVVFEQPLYMVDAQDFFLSFGNHWPYWINANIRWGDQPVRAYIKNGRHEDWSISIGSPGAIPEAARVEGD